MSAPIKPALARDSFDDDNTPLKVRGHLLIEPAVGSSGDVTISFAMNRPANVFEAVASRQLGVLHLDADSAVFAIRTTPSRAKAQTLEALQAVRQIVVEAGNLQNQDAAAKQYVESELNDIKFD